MAGRSLRKWLALTPWLVVLPMMACASDGVTAPVELSAVERATVGLHHWLTDSRYFSLCANRVALFNHETFENPLIPFPPLAETADCMARQADSKIWPGAPDLPRGVYDAVWEHPDFVAFLDVYVAAVTSMCGDGWADRWSEDLACHIQETSAQHDGVLLPALGLQASGERLERSVSAQRTVACLLLWQISEETRRFWTRSAFLDSCLE